jgi:hypothetical protein
MNTNVVDVSSKTCYFTVFLVRRPVIEWLSLDFIQISQGRNQGVGLTNSLEGIGNTLLSTSFWLWDKFISVQIWEQSWHFFAGCKKMSQYLLKKLPNSFWYFPCDKSA